MSGRKDFILLTFSKRNNMNYRPIVLCSLFLSFVLGVKGQQTNTQTYTLKTPYGVEKITPPKGKKVKKCYFDDRGRNEFDAHLHCMDLQ